MHIVAFSLYDNLNTGGPLLLLTSWLSDCEVVSLWPHTACLVSRGTGGVCASQRTGKLGSLPTSSLSPYISVVKSSGSASDGSEFASWKWKWSRSVISLCNPMDCNLPGSFIHGIFQARVLEWIAISFSRRSSWPGDWTWDIAGRYFTLWATREVSSAIQWLCTLIF